MPLFNLDVKLHRQLKTASIYVTYDQLEAMTLADCPVFVNGGRIEQISTPIKLCERPETVFVSGFVGSLAMIFFDGELLGFGKRTDGAPVLTWLRPQDLSPACGGKADDKHLALDMTTNFIESVWVKRIFMVFWVTMALK